MVETTKLPNRTLKFVERVVANAGLCTSVVLCGRAAEAEEAPKPVNTAVTLFSTMVMGDMTVEVELSFPEVVAEIVEAPRLPNRTLTFERVVVKAGLCPSVGLCRLAAEAEEAFKPVNTTVTLFSTMVKGGMNVGVELSFPEVAAEIVEAPRLPKRTLTFDAPVAVKVGVSISVLFCRLAVEVGEAPKPVNVALLLTMVMGDPDPYPGGTPEEGPLGYGNLVT